MGYEILGHSDDRDAWLERRRETVGASDVPAILGVNPWSSALDVQQQKWGTAEDVDNEAMNWGRRLETPIINGMADDLAIDIRPYGFQMRSREWPWLTCTPDAAVYNGGGDIDHFGQIKLTQFDWIAAGKIPEYVNVQVQTEMAVTGHPMCLVGGLIRGTRLAHKPVARDDTLIALIVDETKRFWDATLAQEPITAGASAEALALLYPEDNGETVPLPVSLVEVDEELQDLKLEIGSATKRKKELELVLKAARRSACCRRA